MWPDLWLWETKYLQLYTFLSILYRFLAVILLLCFSADKEQHSYHHKLHNQYSSLTAHGAQVDRVVSLI